MDSISMCRRGLISGAALLLAGCGFTLRRAPELRFRTLQLTGFAARSPLADELKNSINASSTTLVVEAAAQAQVIFEALADSRDKTVVASTAVGQVREFRLRARLNFKVRTPAGKELIGPTEILLTRDLSYSETLALAKEQEAEFLFRAMQSDIVAQVMRRLAALPGL